MRIATNLVSFLAPVLFGMLLVPGAALAVTGNCPVEPAQNVPIASGKTFAGPNCILYTLGDVDSFVFNANSGDTYWFVAAEANEVCNQDIGLTVFDPNHVQIILQYTNSCSGGYVIVTSKTLTTTGLYTVVVSEAGSAGGTRTYGVSLERLHPVPPDAQQLTLGHVFDGVTMPLLYSKAFTWEGVTTGTYRLTASMTPSGCRIDLCVTAYSADGTVAASQCTNSCSGVYTAQVDIPPPQDDGPLMALVEQGGNLAFNYTLDVSCLVGYCAGANLIWKNDDTGQVTVNYFGGPGGSAFTGWNWLNSAGVSGWNVAAVADFDGNGTADLVWQNENTGQVTVNFYGGPGGATFQGWCWLNAATNVGWKVVGAADFDGNGTPDLIWQNQTTRQVTVNYYGGAQGCTLTGSNWLKASATPGWTVAGAADFNGDGVPDLIWQNDTTRQVTVNYYGGTGGATLIGSNWLKASATPGWTVAGAADFNGDGVPDLVWQNDTTRQVTVNYYGGPGGATLTGSNWLNSGSSPGWHTLASGKP